MPHLKKGRFALAAGIFATALWGTQALVAVRAVPAVNFFEITLLLHFFAVLGITGLNMSRLQGLREDMRIILSAKGAFGFFALSGACQSICFLLFYLAVQNGPQVPGMLMHFMWPFIFAASNALFPSTWEQRSSGYEMKVIGVAALGVAFVVASGIAVGENSGIGLGSGVLILAGFVSAVFGCVNAIGDYHGLARSRARLVDMNLPPDLPTSFRYSALQIRFLSGLCLMLLLWAVLGTTGYAPHVAPLHLSWREMLAPFWLGFVVYFGADFFFSYTMTHVSESARSGFNYLPPLIGVAALYLNGAAVDQQMIFGVLIVLFSMFQLQAGTRAWNANTAAPLLFIFSSIIVLQIPVILKQIGLMGDDPFEGINPEVMAGVFAIVISFLLSRLLDRNKSENLLEIENVNIMGEIIEETQKNVQDRNVLPKIKNLAFRLSVYVLDFDVNTRQSRRRVLIQKINAVLEGFGHVVRNAYSGGVPKEIEQRIDELGRGVSRWIYLRSQFLSLAEKWSVVLLSFASVMAFLIATDRSPNWYGDIAAIALITTVFILVFQAFDLGANRSETEVADLLNKQMPLLRHGFLPYVPFELVQKRVFVSEDKALPVITRRPDGAFERVTLPTAQNDLKFLAQLLNAAGLTAIVLLLAHKYAIVRLF